MGEEIWNASGQFLHNPVIKINYQRLEGRLRFVCVCVISQALAHRQEVENGAETLSTASGVLSVPVSVFSCVSMCFSLSVLPACCYSLSVRVILSLALFCMSPLPGLSVFLWLIPRRSLTHTSENTSTPIWTNETGLVWILFIFQVRTSLWRIFFVSVCLSRHLRLWGSEDSNILSA